MRTSHSQSLPRVRSWSSDRDWTRFLNIRTLRRERGGFLAIALFLATIAVVTALPALFLWLEIL